MRRDLAPFEYRPAERVVRIPKPTHAGEELFELRIPALLGAIRAVERRGEFLVVRAAKGKASYHLATDTYLHRKRVGFMVWNSLRKTIRDLCIDPRFAKRVDMHVLYFRNNMVKGGSGSSELGVSGRVTVDKRVVAEGNQLGFALAPALERYLHLEPRARLDDDEPLIRAFALIDRDTRGEAIIVRDEDREDPLWIAFAALRSARSG